MQKALWYMGGQKALFLYGRPSLKQVPDIAGKTFVFVCGLHRSGTSVVHRSLRDCTEVASFERTGVPEDEAQHLQNVIPAGRALGGPGKFAFHPEAHMTENHSLAKPEARDKLLRQWGAYLDLSKSCIIEKSPPNVLRSRFFQQLFPGAKFVFLVRHPVPVALATVKRWGAEGMLATLQHWCLVHRTMLEDLDALDSYLLCRYEDVIAEPENSLQRIYDYIGVPWQGTKETFFDANSRYFSSWEEDADKLRNILDRLGKDDLQTMEKFGYSLTGHYVQSMPQLLDRNHAE